MCCGTCGNQLDEQDFFCGKCGNNRELKDAQRLSVGSSQEEPKQPDKKKVNRIVPASAILLLIVVCGILFLNSEKKKELTPSVAEDYVALIFVKELIMNDREVISISPDGRFALTYDREGSIFVYEWEGDIFQFYKTIEGVPSWRLRCDGSIVWSRCGKQFALNEVSSKLFQTNSDILLVDIETGIIQNLTGIAGEEDVAFDFGDPFLLEISPAWSEDDRGIFFSQFGKDCEGEFFSGLSFFSFETGEIEIILEFDTNESVPYIYPTLIYRNGVLYYVLSSLEREGKKIGIYKYIGGEEAVITESIWERLVDGVIDLLDVSLDGTKILYVCTYTVYGSTSEEGSHFFLASIDALDEPYTLYPTSPERVIHGVFFSPDGYTIMQIESERGTSSERAVYIYVMDVSRPAETRNLLYTEVHPWIFGGNTSFVAAHTRNPLRPIWLTNGYIAINGEVPRLYQVVTREDEE